MAYLSSLSEDQRTTFLVVSLPDRSLRRLVGALGTAPKGIRVEKLSVWELAWTLVDFYASDAEVAGEVDQALLREIGASPLASAVTTEEATTALTELVLRAPDPLRDLAWAIVTSAPESAVALASELVEAIVTEFDEVEARAKEEEAERAVEAEPDDVETADPEEIARQIEKETKSAKRGRERALKRADDMKARVADLESSLSAANKQLKDERAARKEADAIRGRVAAERDDLKLRSQQGPAGQIEKLEVDLGQGARREKALEAQLATLRSENEGLKERVREAGARRVAVPVEGREPSADPAAWSLPVFTAEFYDSIKAWDRKTLRIAFEKIVRLAEDWRHPSLRAIPLEGLAGHYRIRIASDVRLIYRLPEGGRLEILSLIDREDLTRYIRTAKR